MTTLSHLSGFDVEPFPVSRVSVIRPLVWLWRGVGDLRHSPGASLAYGLMVSVMGAIILGFWHHPYLIAGSITGFLLVGPLLTAGLCELSRRRAAGESVDFDASLSVLGRHREALVRFAAGLLIVGALWFAVSTLILGLALGSAGPSVRSPSRYCHSSRLVEAWAGPSVERADKPLGGFTTGGLEALEKGERPARHRRPQPLEGPGLGIGRVALLDMELDQQAEVAGVLDEESLGEATEGARRELEAGEARPAAEQRQDQGLVRRLGGLLQSTTGGHR